ncbi:MAG: type II secretion system protein [Methylobacter sp.]|nr:type II secretion system protein [Candidatus Methylobacter titanis]
MKHYKVKHIARQAGMTLIELSVVLLILVGLAGLLVPYVGSFTQTTHDSTNSNNVTQLNNALGRYVSEKNKLPPHMDLLTAEADIAALVGTGSCATAQTKGDAYCGLANPNTFDAPVAFVADSIQAKSLSSSGINMAVANDASVNNKTFGTSAGMYMLDKPTAGGWATAKFLPVGAAGIADKTVGMMTITGLQQHLATALGRDPMVYKSACYDYIAMGLGDNNELIQSTAVASPVFFPQDAKYGPTERYAHFIAIVQVDKDNTTADCSEVTEKAKFLGVVANVPASESPTLVGANTLLSQTYTNKSAN